MFEKIIEITDFLWGVPLTLIIVCAGIYFGICSKFCQITKIKSIWKNTFGNKEKTENDKRTISTVLAGTIGSRKYSRNCNSYCSRRARSNILDVVNITYKHGNKAC
jgi:hypothetical protein